MSSYQTYTVQYKMKRKVKAGETGAEVEVDFPQTETIVDPYAVLGVGKDTPIEDVKKAYRKLSMETHPDSNQVAGATADQQTLNKAYEFLSEPQKRYSLDKAIDTAAKLSGQADKKPTQASSPAAPRPAQTVQREPQTPRTTTTPPERQKPSWPPQPPRPRENRPPDRPFEGSPQRKQNPFVDKREKTDFPFEPSPRKQPPRENPFDQKKNPKGQEAPKAEATRPEAPTPPGTPEQTTIFKQKRQEIDEATLGYQLPTAADVKYSKVSEDQRAELSRLILQKRVDIYRQAFEAGDSRATIEYSLGTLKYDLTGNLITKEAYQKLLVLAQEKIYSILVNEIKTAKNSYSLPTSYFLEQMLKNEELSPDHLASLQIEIGNKRHDFIIEIINNAKDTYLLPSPISLDESLRKKEITAEQHAALLKKVQQKVHLFLISHIRNYKAIFQLPKEQDLRKFVEQRQLTEAQVDDILLVLKNQKEILDSQK